MKPLQIGNIRIETPVVLGPMAGVTDLPFRLLCKEQGAGLVCTEMISAKALLYHNKNTQALMRIHPMERPAALQLFGSDPDTIAEAAVQIGEEPFDLYDINMGCPMPKIVNNGEGSALMKDPALDAAIVDKLVRSVKKPVTVKIRRGFADGEDTAAELAKALEAAGAAAIAVHGRTREQYYEGKADWSCIRRVKEAVSIPVIANGDVNSPKAAEAVLRETGADGVMIARAARGNPWIFRDVAAWLRLRELYGPEEAERRMPERPSGEEIYRMIARHAQMLLEEKGEYTGVREMRKHISWYTTGLPHSASLRRKINAAESREEMLEIAGSVLLRV